MNDRCWTTRNEFMNAVGIVNAEIKMVRTAVRFETKYRLVAERIHSMGRSIGANSVHSITDDGLYIVTVKGFRQVKGGTDVRA